MDLREVPDKPFQRHPWEVARRRFFQRVLREGGALEQPLRILDVGAGDAYFARTLIEAAPAQSMATCWDSAYDVFDRGLLPDDERLRYCTAQPQERYDLVLLLDILEHVDDDVEFLRDIIASNVRPEGYVLISVPARMLLFSRHDRYLHHFRRYAPRELREVLAQAQLHPLRSGGLFHSLAPVRMLQKAKEAIAVRLFGAGDDPTARETYRGLGGWGGGRGLSSVLTGALQADTWISLQLSNAGIDLPGLSWWALCKTQPS